MDNAKLAMIRTIPERFNQYYLDTKAAGCSEGLAASLAREKIGQEAVEAVQFLLEEMDREDDLK